MSKWIDVKDRLPEEDKEVLICSQWGTIDVGWHYDTYWATEHNTYEDVGDIVAWMPLPEPYKKRGGMMKIDLCKIFGVEEEEEFKVDAYVIWFSNFKYKIRDNALLHSKLRENDFTVCGLSLNELKYIKEIIRLPKKKSFSQDTLNFFKLVDKKYKWIAKDKSGDIFGFEEKPKKDKYVWLCEEYDYCLDNTCCIDGLNQSLFDKIYWEDEEPIYIDDYVER